MRFPTCSDRLIPWPAIRPGLSVPLEDSGRHAYDGPLPALEHLAPRNSATIDTSELHLQQEPASVFTEGPVDIFWVCGRHSFVPT